MFIGGFTLEAAEEVCSGEGWKSARSGPALSAGGQIARGGRGGSWGAFRYRMLEPVRQFALRKASRRAESAGGPPAARRALPGPRREGRARAVGGGSGTVVRAAEDGDREPQGRALVVVGARRGSRERADELRLRLVAALGRFWDVQGFEEGKGWLEVALERDAGGYPAVRAKALNGLGLILLFQQDYERAIAALEEAVVLHKELGDESGAALALGNLGYAVLHGGFRERVPAFVEEGEALMRGDLDGHARAFLRLILASAPIEEGDLDSAVSQLEESLALCRELGDMRDIAMSLFTLGMIELIRGDLDRGAATLEEGARITRELKDRPGIAYHAWALGEVNALRGRPVRAARLWGAAEALREQMGMSLSQFDLAQSRYEQGLADVRSALSEASFEAAWAEGRAMSSEQAIDYALEEPEAPHDGGRRPWLPPGGRAGRGRHPPPAGATVRIFALGPARVEKDGRPIDSPDWIQKPRELLYYLLSHPEGRTKEQIGLALWPEASTSQLRSSFHDTLYRLRRALGGKEWVSFEKGRYTFERSLPYSYDVEAFEENLSEGRRVQTEAPDRAIGTSRRLPTSTGAISSKTWCRWRVGFCPPGGAKALLPGGAAPLGRAARGPGAPRRGGRGLQEGHLPRPLPGGGPQGADAQPGCPGREGPGTQALRGAGGVAGKQLGASPAPETVALYESLRSGE